jgi:hypothetical protein
MCILIGVTVLVPADWLYQLEVTTTPLGKYIRAMLIVIFIIYLLITGIDFTKYGFKAGLVFALFAVLNILYALLSENVNDNIYYTSRIIYWLLGTVVVYRLVVSEILSDKAIEVMIIVTVILGSLFTAYYMEILNNKAGQNASAYLLLWCLPLLLKAEKKLLVNVSLVLAIIAIILTVKRGAMIGLVLSLVVYYISYIKVNKLNNALLKALGSVIVVVLATYYVLSMNWEAVQLRFDDTTGSGRDMMYMMIWEHWINADITNIIFGFGINSVQQYLGIMYYGSVDESGPYAHSDWLQLMHDYGLLGIGLLAWLHLEYLKLLLKAFKARKSFAPSLLMGYVILFLVNVYSGQLMAPNAIYFGMLVAFAAAKLNGSRKCISKRYNIKKIRMVDTQVVTKCL